MRDLDIIKLLTYDNVCSAYDTHSKLLKDYPYLKGVMSNRRIRDAFYEAKMGYYIDGVDTKPLFIIDLQIKNKVTPSLCLDLIGTKYDVEYLVNSVLVNNGYVGDYKLINDTDVIAKFNGLVDVRLGGGVITITEEAYNNNKPLSLVNGVILNKDSKVFVLTPEYLTSIGKEFVW